MRRQWIQALLVALAACGVQAQDGATITRPADKHREEHEAERNRFNALPSYYRSWLTEDVVYIITPGERRELLLKTSDQERDQFIDSFWERRNPVEGMNENTFKEEHYRRIAYANQFFGGAVTGWKTDRGRLYIALGPPDVVTSLPAGRECNDPEIYPNVTVRNAPANETWRYKNLDKNGDDTVVVFVAQPDPTDGTTDRSSFILSQNACKAEPTGPTGIPRGMERATAIDTTGIRAIPDGLYIHIEKYEPPQNRDLEAAVVSHLVRTQIPIEFEFDTVPVTTITSVASLKILVPGSTLAPAAAKQVAPSV